MQTDVTAPRLMPPAGAPATVTFPPIARASLATGLSVWSIALPGTGVVSCHLVLGVGSAHDPVGQPGLAGATADMLDEGAAGRDAVELAEFVARLGTAIEVEVGADVTSVGFTALPRSLGAAMQIIGDLVARPHLAEPDFERVRELRQGRLRQLQVTATAAADRAFLAAVFGAHPYGHGTLGTTRALAEMAVDDIRSFHATWFRPSAATLIVAGDVDRDAVVAAAASAFADWSAGARALGTGVVAPPVAERASGAPPIVLVHRAGAPQSVLRIGHLGPPRLTPAYHALLTLNGVLGGQFSSRLNATLREARGYTYGARTSFEFRRVSGSFGCDTSVQADATAPAIAEVLREFGDVGRTGTIAEAELARAKASLTRGYVRQFETADQVARGAIQLATFGLDDLTFARFVPAVEAVGAAEVEETARAFVRPADSAIVVVGDADRCAAPLETLGRPVIDGAPEF
jgi:zinc protease